MIFKYKKSIIISNFDKEIDLISEKIKNLNLPKGFFEFIIYTLSELLVNVKEHAKIDKISLVVIIDKKRSLINVVDKGIGLKQSYLSHRIYAKDDFSAIEFALSGLSTKAKGSQERGFGLYSIRKFIEEVRGEIIMESGLARVFIQKNKINFQNLKRKVRGTSINLNTPLKKIDFYKIIT